MRSCFFFNRFVSSFRLMEMEIMALGVAGSFFFWSRFFEKSKFEGCFFCYGFVSFQAVWKVNFCLKVENERKGLASEKKVDHENSGKPTVAR